VAWSTAGIFDAEFDRAPAMGRSGIGGAKKVGEGVVLMTRGAKTSAPQHEKVFLRLLGDAATKVTAEYMALPQHVAPSGGVSEAYLERVYCYELYHQMRGCMDRAVDTPLADAVARGWRLNGEVDKVTSYIPGRRVPDFIWHVPGTSENGHVVEVKRAAADIRSIHSDVQKLESFKQVAGYQHATLLVVGTRGGSGRFDSLVASAEAAGVNVMFHREPGAPLSTQYDR
jgi:hypothetical protein